MIKSTPRASASAARFHPESSPDYIPAAHLRWLQSVRLAQIVRRAYEGVPFYQRRMEQRRLTPDDVCRVEDLPKLPFTVKQDLHDARPFGLFASPMGEVVRLHASSGTTGEPIVVAYTQEDLAVWTSVMVRALVSCGLDRGDVIQNAYGYGLFTGGLGFHYGGEALGATVIPISGGNADRQITIMKDFGVSAICCTPSYFLHLIDRAAEIDVNLSQLPLRTGVFGAEPWTEWMRLRIQEATGITAFDIYGLSEIIGPGIAAECFEQNGLHVFEDHFYPEIVDPVTGEVLPDGSEGELVLTTLSKTAMPMLRYRTRDITSIIAATCACGRTIRRIKRISHRSNDMFIIRGVNVFPSQIEAALLAVREVLPHYQIVLTREKGVDQIEVRIEVTPEVFSDRISALERLEQKIAGQIEQTAGIRVAVSLVEPRTLRRSEGKAERVIDKR